MKNFKLILFVSLVICISTLSISWKQVQAPEILLSDIQIHHAGESKEGIHVQNCYHQALILQLQAMLRDASPNQKASIMRQIAKIRSEHRKCSLPTEMER